MEAVDKLISFKKAEIKTATEQNNLKLLKNATKELEAALLTRQLLSIN